MAKDSEYIIAANTVTISKFGPSGSSKRKNDALDNNIEVIARMIREDFGGLGCMWGIVALIHLIH
ncbi:MAG: hypothetical protein AB7O73_15690 [Bacteroidia bacterium]